MTVHPHPQQSSWSGLLKAVKSTSTQLFGHRSAATRARPERLETLPESRSVEVYHASAWVPARALAVRATGHGEQLLVDLEAAATTTRPARWVDRDDVRQPPGA